MGLWDWVLQLFSGGSQRSAARQESCGDDGDTAVAVIDAPDGGADPDAPPWWEHDTEASQRLDEVFEPTRPELSTEALGLERLLVQQFDGHNLELPPFPEVPAKVLQELASSKCDFGRIADDIARDQVVATAVIRLANSPFYRGAYEITAIKPAITRIGSNSLRTLMYNQTLRAAALTTNVDRVLSKYVLDRAMASASVMYELAEFASINKEDGLLLGLLHDIGYVIVLRETRKQLKFVKYALDLDTFEYLAHECHQEFGELIANEWSLPETVCALIADHHKYPEPDDPLREERLLLQLCDMILSLMGYCPMKPYELIESRAAQDLGLSNNSAFREMLVGLPERVEEALEYL